MFKKIEVWVVLLLLLIFLVCTILYGALLRLHYKNIERFPELQKIAVFFAEIPSNLKNINTSKIPKIFTNQDVDSLNKKSKPGKSKKNKNLPKFKRFIKTDRNALLVLPRYDSDLLRSVVEIIDINTFKVLHTYKHDITAMNNLVDISSIEHERVRIDDSEIRFEYRHPLILDDGSLIADSDFAPLFKIDFCSNLIWLNQEERFHHSKMLDKDGTIWVGAQMFPYSSFVKEYKSAYGYIDDAIAKVDKDGNILFIKSISEMLFENEIINETLFLDNDPTHLNDIEPAFVNTNYWEKGDLFISIAHKSAIIHYRPSTNKIINYIRGPFYMQHDVDIISDKEISIFNNNNSVLKNSKFSEVVIYNFETKTFSKKFNQQLQNENFKTKYQGLTEILKDSSMLIEETLHGRLILFNKDGEKEWEYVNKDKKGDIYFISWARIIEDFDFIKKIKNKIEKTKCSNS